MSRPNVTAGLKRLAGRIAAIFLTGLLGAAVLVAESHAATLGRDWNFERSIESASLIFEGKVTAIDFRDSKPQARTGVSIPHTFVTYEINETLRGRTSLQQITLRFLGGWAQKDGRIMVVPHAPLFKVGNRDILLVGKNGSAACPLISCGLGRFRVFENEVYSDSGLAVRLSSGNSVGFGPEKMPSAELQMDFPPAPATRLQELKEQLNSNKQISSAERARLSRRLRDMSTVRTLGPGREVSNRGVVIPQAPHASKADFTAFVVAVSKRYPVSGPPVATAAPDVDFEFPELELRAAEPPSRITRPPVRPLTSEQQLLKQNGGNPVLRVQQ